MRLLPAKYIGWWCVALVVWSTAWSVWATYHWIALTVAGQSWWGDFYLCVLILHILIVFCTWWIWRVFSRVVKR